LADATSIALLTTAASTALLHTAIPDHWLPFALMGRAQGWAARRVALVSGLSGLVHSALSLALALTAAGVGIGAASAIGHAAERVAGVLLVVFGLGYAWWSWRKSGHFHPGGARLHRSDETAACGGGEGPGHPEHLHYHADGAWIRGGTGRGAVGLALIVGLNPCVLVLPVVLAGAARGAVSAILVALAYAVPTVLLTVALSVLGARGRFPFRLPRAARLAEPASGLLIAALGLVLLFVA
jgi:hypothetical protein